MALDIIARAAAASAQNAATQALSLAGSGGAAALNLFSDLPSLSVATNVTTLSSAGYTASGRGAATYVSDSLANATLAASHPRFCKATANGRYFRLNGEYVTVEQAGATGLAGTNDQPAIQAAINYAMAAGIKEVRFTQAAYDLWCPTRTSSSGPGIATAPDGYPIYIAGSIALVGIAGGSNLTFLNSAGGAKTSGLQTTAWGTWYGGGIWVNANAPGATGDIDHVHLENLTMDGTVPYVAANGNGGSNLSDKGISFPSNGTKGVRLLTMKNVIAHNFCGELFYGASFLANSTIIAENVELYNSNQSAWNPTGLGKVVAVNLNAHDSYLPSEIITGQGHLYVGCRFANGTNCGAIPTQFFTGGYSYTYPNRDLTKAPTWCQYDDCTFENINVVNISSWTRGRVTSIDSSWVSQNWNDRDIYLEMDFLCDQKNGVGITINGPANLTTQFANSPAGVYYEPPKNISLKINSRRTARGVTNGVYSDLVTYTGLIDKATVRVEVTGELRQAYKAGGTPPTGYAIPLTIIDPGITLQSGAQPFGGIYDPIAADATYKVAWSAMSFYPTGTGPYNITLDNTYGYCHGQLVTFYYAQNSAQVISFAPSGAGMKLREARKLAGQGDRLVLMWDSRANAWVEHLYESTVKQLFSGSATYDAPSIAVGASASATVTVTGAALGDYVERISLGVSAAGLTVTGYVSAANTVTVVLANLTAAAVDLASTTINVEVRKKL